MVTPSGLCLKESMYPIDLILKCQHGYVALRQFRVQYLNSVLQFYKLVGEGEWGGLVVLPLTKSLYKYNNIAY